MCRVPKELMGHSRARHSPPPCPPLALHDLPPFPSSFLLYSPFPSPLPSFKHESEETLKTKREACSRTSNSCSKRDACSGMAS